MTSILSYLDKIAGALVSFKFPDFLDVILVTIVIYELIKLIRGSRSFQVIKGIVLLIFLYITVKLLNMEASEYLISKLFENALLILVILFSPELRNILEKFGRRSIHKISFFNFKNNAEFEKEITDTVNDFCKAAGDMSETKTGALVVFEREATLQEIIDSGTLLDARSSPELFNGLFFKNSALHDGAVVVRDAKIYAAGCILPLTQNTSLSSDLGTRHRAAIGVSENSDCVSVIVSEETGGISVAINGELSRDVSTGKLREILLGALLPEKDDRKKEKRSKHSVFEKSTEEGDRNE